MKISIFTTVTDAFARGDNPLPALKCYQDLADEVVIVDGGAKPTFGSEISSVRVVPNRWPKEFSWELFGKQFQKGYEACTGDWVIRADLDYLFHESDFKVIKKAIKDNPHALGLSFFKWQFILPDRYNVKSRLVVAINKGQYGDRVRFDGGGDMCQATFDGQWIDPNEVPEARVPIYNYEKLLKTKAQIMDDVGRMERAWKRYYGRTQYRTDGTDISAYKNWVKAQVGKFSKPQQHIKLYQHPKYMVDSIDNLTPDQWGFNGHNHLEVNDYAKSFMRI